MDPITKRLADAAIARDETVEVTSPLGTGYVSLDDAVASIAAATNLDDDALRDSLLAGDILEVAGVEYALVRGEVSSQRVALDQGPEYPEEPERPLLRPGDV